MIKGVVHNHQPIISINIGSELGAQDFLVLIDTGFTGDLKLSREKAIELGMQATHVEEVILADQQKISMSVGVAFVAMDGATCPVSVLIAPGFPVVGVGLMKRFAIRLTIDFVHDILSLQRNS